MGALLETVASDPKLLASAKVGRNLRTVNDCDFKTETAADVLAGQARDVGAGPANVCGRLRRRGCLLQQTSTRRGGTGAAENHEIELFRLRHLN